MFMEPAKEDDLLLEEVNCIVNLSSLPFSSSLESLRLLRCNRKFLRRLTSSCDAIERCEVNVKFRYLIGCLKSPGLSRDVHRILASLFMFFF